MRRELVVCVSPEEQRVAILEDGRAAELMVERSGSRLVGSIHLGRVDKLVPGMQAAFVDIGLARAAFLHAGDVAEDPEGILEGEEDEPDGSGGRRRRAGARPIQSLLRQGQEIAVQVTREPLGGKGARLTTQLTLAGRHVVLAPRSRFVGVSRRIEPEHARERWRALLEELRGDAPWGGIVRTAASDAPAEQLAAELRELREEWTDVERRMAELRAPACVRRAPPLGLQVVVDVLSEETERILVDDRETLERIRRFVALRVPARAGCVELHEGPEPLWESLGLDQELDKALRPRAWLKSGGHLIIDQLEALVAIDVNTGKFTGSRNLEDTALRTNLEAAREAARQLRLRDLGGIVVIDFIDMEEEAHRRAVLEELERALTRDRAKVSVHGMSELCLVQVTRQRQRRSLRGELCEECPTCRGTGQVRSVATVIAAVTGRLRQSATGRGTVAVRAHPRVARALSAHLATLPPTDAALARGPDVVEDPDLDPQAFELTGQPD